MGRSDGGNSVLRKLGPILFLLFIAYVAAVTIPVVVSTFRFSQAMDREVMHGPVTESPAVIRRRLEVEAQRLGLTMTSEQIMVRKSGPRVEIDADYVVPVELLGGFTFDWRFQPHKEGVRRPPAFGRD